MLKRSEISNDDLKIINFLEQYDYDIRAIVTMAIDVINDNEDLVLQNERLQDEIGELKIQLIK